MSKIHVLRNNQIYMSFLGLYSYNLEEPSNEFFRTFGSYYVVFTLMLCSYGCGAFVSKNWTVNVSGSLGAIKIGFAMVQSVGSFVNIGLNKKNIKTIHLALQQSVDEVKNMEVRDIYWKCEQSCRLFTIRLGYFNIFHLSTFVFVLFKVIFDIIIGKTDTSAWNLALDLNLPIDTTNVFGWLLMFFSQMCMANCYAMSMTSITSYFVSCTYYINAMCDHFNFTMKEIDEDVERNHTEMNPRKIKKNRVKTAETLSAAIRIHINMFDKFYMLADIFSGTIFALLPCNAGFLSLVMYDIERSTTSLDFWVLNWNFSCLLCCLFWPSLICYSATVVGVQMASIGDMAFESIWYKYHPQLRKYMILIIRRSQEPVYFTGLNLVYCTLEVFGKIIKTSCSYYIIFRTMARR